MKFRVGKSEGDRAIGGRDCKKPEGEKCEVENCGKAGRLKDVKFVIIFIL